ncbi:MAG: peptidoglycan-binding domain-containing protein [Pseudomonadota bacterium]
MKHLLSLIFASLAVAAPVYGQAADLPPSALPGQCFTRVVSPTITETVTETVLVRPETERFELVPAVFRPSTERVLIKEETVAFQMVPAVYETVTEDILVEPARTVTEPVAAQYETYSETIIITPERQVWKPGRGLMGRSSATPEGSPQATGDLLCRVVEPAVTRTVERIRLISPPTTRERMIPARFETVSRRVIVTPARIEEVIVPAEYRDVPTQVLVTPAEERRVVEPAVYETVTRQERVGGGDVVWAEVLCETNTTRFKVAEIQGALTDAGYPTRVDGVFGPDTLRAMQRFQQDEALAEGYLTIDTVQALGINPYERPPDLVFALLGSHADA